jgi:hypothetical protein
MGTFPRRIPMNEEVQHLMDTDTLPFTSTITEHPICQCGEQMDRFVNINTKVRAVKIKDHCSFCGYYKLQPWEIVRDDCRTNLKNLAIKNVPMPDALEPMQ